MDNAFQDSFFVDDMCAGQFQSPSIMPGTDCFYDNDLYAYETPVEGSAVMYESGEGYDGAWQKETVPLLSGYVPETTPELPTVGTGLAPLTICGMVSDEIRSKVEASGRKNARRYQQVEEPKPKKKARDTRDRKVSEQTEQENMRLRQENIKLRHQLEMQNTELQILRQQIGDYRNVLVNFSNDHTQP